jgi:hypothetical protein
MGESGDRGSFIVRVSDWTSLQFEAGLYVYKKMNQIIK